MSAVIDAIAGNFIGYDLIIFIIGLVNGFILYITNIKLKYFREAIYRPNDLAARKKNEEIIDKVTKEDLNKIKKARAEANGYYSIFANVIAIFPLLGLLGTVISLINVAGDGSFENTQYSFMLSLTSTLWGMIFAILYKICDARISPEVEMLNSDAKRAIIVQED